jgi:hypothetical protein
VGRPSKFTQAARDHILHALKIGSSLRTAAAYAGIDHRTLLRWLKEGKEAESGAKYDFYLDCDAAQASPKLRALQVVHDEMPNKPELAKWFLERREREFAPPQPSLPAASSGPVTINLALAGGSPLPQSVIEGEVVDEQDSRSLPAPTSTA